MHRRKTLALLLTAIGLILTFVGPFVPGGIHLVPAHPLGAGHVTTLIAAPGGEVFAGTQSGEVWRLADGVWTREAVALGGQPVTAMLGDPRRNPVGTSAGLVNAPQGTPPLDERVGSLVRTRDGLLAGTARGVRRLVEGRWDSPGPAANVYSLFTRSSAEGDWLHAGTIGSGVLSAPAGSADAPWQPNSLGLPEAAKVFCFAATPGGRLLAGTDAGLFWQSRPGDTWRSLSLGLEGKRVLALDLAPAEERGGRQRLWIGRALLADPGREWRRPGPGGRGASGRFGGEPAGCRCELDRPPSGSAAGQCRGHLCLRTDPARRLGLDLARRGPVAAGRRLADAAPGRDPGGAGSDLREPIDPVPSDRSAAWS